MASFLASLISCASAELTRVALGRRRSFFWNHARMDSIAMVLNSGSGVPKRELKACHECERGFLPAEFFGVDRGSARDLSFL